VQGGQTDRAKARNTRSRMMPRRYRSAAKVEHCACQRGDGHAVNRRHVPFSEWRRMHMYDGTSIATAVPIPCDMHTINCCLPDGQPVQYGG
jgi:hypothetical protein